MLLLHRHLPHAQVLAGVRKALAAGALTADAVAIEARKAKPDLESSAPRPVSVLSLPERVVAAAPTRLLPADLRPLPSVAIYDELLEQPREVGS